MAAHPNIVRRFSIGRSYEGREIWAVKISDNVGVDEDEPEVLMDALIHANERASEMMAMYIIQLLTSGYGSDERLTDIVNTREIFIVPMLNPDGADYDISNRMLHDWRKNRQPIPDSTAYGVDLNRQFGYKWGCVKGDDGEPRCGRSSYKPASKVYRGPSAWFAPEVRAYRDFINSRVVNGSQQIRAIISWHAAGKLVLWPYSYTKSDGPETMSADDHAAFVALGRQLAEHNGYRPEQSSDLYISMGDQNDWAYHEHRIFAYTIEMARGAVKLYPTRDELRTDLERNREAVLYFLEQADCPYRAAGLDATYCGPQGSRW